MPIDISRVAFDAKVPELPPVAVVGVHADPCLRDRRRVVDGLAEALGITLRGTVDVPFGYIVGGAEGQVEVFTASGAVRARNTDRLAAYESEARRWADVDKIDTPEGVLLTLGEHTQRLLLDASERLIDGLGLAEKEVTATISVERWAAADEDGRELDAGLGRAVVKRGYEFEGLPLLGAGAKTNLHFDPADGEGGSIVRFFHAHRGFEGAREVRLLDLERSLGPLLSQTWSGIDPDPAEAMLTITEATFGLLALPAHLHQRAAVPVLMVQGGIGGLGLPGDAELRFGQFLPLADPDALVEAGFGGTIDVAAGQVVRGRANGR